MKNWDITQRKFTSLKKAHQHKLAADLLRQCFETKDIRLETAYASMESWMGLEPLDVTFFEEVSTRFHSHCQEAGLSHKEHHLLQVRQKDSPSHEPFLPINVVMASMRSAFNVGSIFRTTEAFRLGSLHSLGSTPTPRCPKVQKASMGTSDKVPFFENTRLETLPKPWICLETASPSTPIHSFTFPQSFTLILGNEEYGVPNEILKSSDHIVEIPLCGSKNSLNVASAYAIVAATIRAQIKARS